MGLIDTLRTNLFNLTLHRLATEETRHKKPGTPIPTSLPPNKIANFPAPQTNLHSTFDHLSVTELSFQLDIQEKQHLGDLNWRTSIADLLKILDVDHSLSARKELASDLNCSQSLIDSEDPKEMDTWLHSKVLEILSEHTDGDLSPA